MNALLTIVRWHYWRILGKLVMWHYCTGQRALVWYRHHSPVMVLMDYDEVTQPAPAEWHYKTEPKEGV